MRSEAACRLTSWLASHNGQERTIKSNTELLEDVSFVMKGGEVFKH
jgi:hypothetical protein